MLQASSLTRSSSMQKGSHSP